MEATGAGMKLKVLISFAIVYIVWGSTFGAIKVGLDSFPPIVLAGFRFILAGMVFLTFSKLSDFKSMTSKDYRNEIIVGLLLNMGNAGVCWSEQYISTGMAALILGLLPVIFMIFNWVSFEKKVPHASAMVAMLLGFSGIGLISATGSSAPDWKVVAMLLLANCSWVIGSLRFKTSKSNLGYFPRAAVQLISGGSFLILFSGLSGEEWKFEEVKMYGVLSVIFLALAGTVIAYTAYAFILKNSTTELASTYALVNPLIALFLGIIFLGETMTIQMSVATVLILTSVVLTLYGEKFFRPKAIKIRENKSPRQ